ncbi:hypothetical protein [Streptomyces uncialis]|uniref:hypothetical protein n=1 Tax=Streptomyces uncialis TaxID=1048205 RepID=UPI00225C243E|nr:hypothetical protein [Streptomyces uncialis]MCX4661430.1 hypothetical protein [Streptomyces uncialis]
MTSTPPPTPPIPPIPPADRPDAFGPPHWGPTTPAHAPQPSSAGGKPSRRWALLTHGATAVVALMLGMAATGGGDSGGAGDGKAAPAPTVTVTKAPRGGAPEPAATVTKTVEKTVKETVTAKPKPAPKKAAEPGPSAAIEADGMFLVGEDIQAGTYKTAGPEDDDFGLGCYWSRQKDASGELTGIIANGNITGMTRVTVNKGEYFETTGCLEWRKVS